MEVGVKKFPKSCMTKYLLTIRFLVSLLLLLL